MLSENIASDIVEVVYLPESIVLSGFVSEVADYQFTARRRFPRQTVVDVHCLYVQSSEHLAHLWDIVHRNYHFPLMHRASSASRE